MVLTVLTAFSMVLLQQTVRDAGASKRDQNWAAALAAAQAGIDDYQSRLNLTDGAYFQYNTASPDSDNPAMGQALGKPSWASVPQVGGGTARAGFHYDVDTSTYTGTGGVAPNGIITVTSTGRVGTKTRTLQAQVRRSGFLDYVYFTDYETEDPLDYATQSLRDYANSYCANTYYPGRGSQCTDIQFANDTVNGPLHSNDAILICNNARFQDAVTTMYKGSAGRNFRTDVCSSTSGTSFVRSGDPRTVAKVTMPSTNSSLKAQTAATASPRGCLFTGPTKVVIDETQVLVTSPWTRVLTPGCTKDSWMPIPANGVIYVDDVPADGGTDPNSWPTGSVAGKPTCLDPQGNQKNNVGYPIPDEVGWIYPCLHGDAFVQERSGSVNSALDGRLTIAAHQNLYVTNNVDYKNGTSGSSFLGLIAEQFVYYWHPTDSNNANLNLPGQSSPFQNARISAALLSVNHAVTTMNYAEGVDLGILNITGGISQKYRGIVKKGNAGYSKNYVYDKRLKYDAPPHFLSPTSSSFVSARFTELAPAYPSG